jgi:type II secretory pathway pseudopilin PulG
MNMRINTFSIRRVSGCRRGGFTLIEAALTTIIVGLGTVAMLSLLASGTNANEQAAKLTTAVNLANNLHELADRVPFPAVGSLTWGVPSGQSISTLLTTGDLSWLNGQTFNPPVDATNTAINGMSGWSQVVSVNSVSNSNITSTLTNSAVNPMASVSVTIEFSNQPIFTTSWVVAR